MNIATSLYTGKLVRLTRIELEKDPEALAEWSKDATLARMLNETPARPLASEPIKKRLEIMEKEMDEKHEMFYFHIRPLEDETLIGFVDLNGANPHGDTFVGIGIGEREYWGKGYGTEAMKLVLRFAFTELGLHRVSLDVFEYNPRGVKSYEKAGFRMEGRVREMILRDGQRSDVFFMGVLREDWLKQFGAEYGLL